MRKLWICTRCGKVFKSRESIELHAYQVHSLKVIMPSKVSPISRTRLKLDKQKKASINSFAEKQGGR